MKLEELVPPLELCKLIPKGEFEDSALMWVEDVHPTLTPFVELRRYTIKGDDYIPAPTLQEIMEDLTKLCVTPEIFHAHKNYWTAQGETLDDEGMYKYHYGCSSNPATAALKLWLELKGIE